MLNIRPSLIVLSLGMIFPGFALAAFDESAAIRAVIDNQEAAWNRGDLEAFMTGYAPSSTTTFVSGDEVTHGWQTVHDRYAKNTTAPKRWAP